MTPFLNAWAPPTDREQLYSVLDGFMNALLARDAARVKWHKLVRYTENNVPLMVGDGLWNTISGRGSYDLRFADLERGQVGLFSTIFESDDESAFTLRLRVVENAIAEVEIIVVRQLDSGIKFENQRFWRKPVLEEILPPASRTPRERMIALANGYFSTLEGNDGVILTKFHPDCDRVENGVRTTRNPDFHVAVSHLGCEEQFLTGQYRYDDRVRGRRFPLVDEERGLVLASAFIDHCGKVVDYKLTDGTIATSKFRRPHTYHLLELFKIRDSAIQQIEANFITVPYHMTSPWDVWSGCGDQPFAGPVRGIEQV